MLDHFNLPVSNIQKSAAFYVPVLASLNMFVLYREADVIGFGKDSWEFGIVEETEKFPRIHVAFSASSQTAVREFYRIALQIGGRNNGEAGLRPEYGSQYYAAYVLDPDGHNIEAVCRNAG